MTENTTAAVNAILAADSTIPPELRKAAIRLLSGNGEPEKPLPRLVRTSEAVRLFGVTPKALRDWGDKGILEPVYAGKSACRLGYTAASVRRVLEGRGGEVDADKARARAALMRDKAAQRAPSKQAKRRA